MRNRTNKIPSLKTVKALRGESLIIDLGKTFEGSLQAWMKKSPNDATYRSFEIIDNRYLKLSKTHASDYLDIEGNLIESVKGKWYFDVEQLPDGGVSGQDEKTIFEGIILFYEDITGSGGFEVVDPIDGATFVSLFDTPNDYGSAYQIVRMNGAADGLEFVNPDFTPAEVASILNHIASYSNPHNVTKDQVGLDQVDNTSDADKPVSIAQQNALDLKADLTALQAHENDSSNPHNVDKTQVGLGNVDNTSDVNKPVSIAQQLALDGKVDNSRVLTDVPAGAVFTDTIYDDSPVVDHIADVDNPHSVTKAQVGLGNVDNTSDADKPVSTAQQAAIDLKADSTSLQAHEQDLNNPHSVTKAQVGLSNVDNTSDVAKPVSTAQQAAIDSHANRTDNPHGVTKVQVGLGNVPNVDATNASNITTGTLPSSVLPPVALTSIQLAADESSMLALTTEEGDVVVRTDESKTYMRNAGTSGTIADFTELQTPTDAVLSVNGQTGTVSLTTTNIPEGSNLYYEEARVNANVNVAANSNHRVSVSNPHNVTKAQVGLGNVDNTSDADKPVSTAQQAALNLKADITYVDSAAGLVDEKVDVHIGDLANPHQVTLEQARAEGNQLAGDIDMNNNSLSSVNEIQFANALGKISWNDVAKTINVDTGIGPVIQVGQEFLVPVFNNTGSTLLNGRVVYGVGPTNAQGVPHVEYAIANDHKTISGQLAVMTADCLPGQAGFATILGVVRDLDTTGLAPGTIYLSATTPGVLTNVKPEFPNYPVNMGIALNSQINGKVGIDVVGVIADTFGNFWNGTIRESFDFRITSDGVNVTGTLTPTSASHDNLTLVFSDGFTALNTNPGATIALTSGLDDNPQKQYVYITKANKTLEVSTGGWPTIEHIKIADVSLRSATSTQSEGALINRNWNEHVQDTDSGQGHLSHIAERIRTLPAYYRSGVDTTVSIVAGSPDDVYVSTTGGKVLQMHIHNFDPMDMQTGSIVNVVNDSVNPYNSVSNLNQITLDAQGNSLNNSSFSLVLWGVTNKTGEADHLMINLPTNSYAFASPQDAIDDAFNYSVYSIPRAFEGVGFLISRITFTYKNGAWSLEDVEDLRGIAASSVGGGGIGGQGVTSFLGLTDTPSTYAGQATKVVTVSAGEDSLEFTPATVSVFGRTGAVVAQANDYTWAQIDKSLASLSDIPSRSHTLLSDIGSNSHAQIDSHIASIVNPHGVTKTQVGLSNVPNVDTTNASNIASGTLADGRLSSNVALRNSSTAFTANQLIQTSGVAQMTIYTTGGGASSRLQLTSSTGGLCQVQFGDAADSDAGKIQYSHANNSFSFKTNGINDQFSMDAVGNFSAVGKVIANGGDSNDWNTAYSWGDHSVAGYLTAESDTLASVIARGNVDIYGDKIIETYSGDLVLGDINRSYIELHSVNKPCWYDGTNTLDIATEAWVTSQGYNNNIGTSTNLTTTGAEVPSLLSLNGGVVQSFSKRTLTLADLGYTGATNANYITNNNQLSNGAGYITSSALSAYLPKTGGTLDNGTSTSLTIKCDDAGEAVLSLRGDNQGTGRLFVGQSSTYGGGIEYNGDNAPGYSGAGSDYITLYRVSNGTPNWTARNSQGNNDWEFRNNVKAVSFTENGVALSSKYQAKGTYNTIIGTDADIDTSGATIIDNIYVTDGVITSMGTRALTLGDLGYTGATNANYYSHPGYTSRSIATSGAQVLSTFTSDSSGHVTGITTRSLSASDIGALSTSGKAADSNLLDGIDSGSFLRSDATDYINNTLYNRGFIVNETAYRNRGIYGNYDSYKTNHIWSMGVAYENAADGSNFGNLYGLAYKHTNNTTGGTMAGGHQMVWCQNGTPYAAMGNGIWTSGAIYEYGNALSNRYQAKGTYNTIIGTDTDHTFTGAEVLDSLVLTDGVITNYGVKSLSYSDVGAAASSHSHSTYLPKTGGTISGGLTVTGLITASGGIKTSGGLQSSAGNFGENHLWTIVDKYSNLRSITFENGIAVAHT